MKKIELGRFRILIEDKERRREIAQKAARTKAQKAQEKIKQAIEELKKGGKKITPYRVALRAGVSYNTAKKYLS